MFSSCWAQVRLFQTVSAATWRVLGLWSTSEGFQSPELRSCVSCLPVASPLARCMRGLPGLLRARGSRVEGAGLQDDWGCCAASRSPWGESGRLPPPLAAPPPASLLPRCSLALSVPRGAVSCAWNTAPALPSGTGVRRHGLRAQFPRAAPVLEASHQARRWWACLPVTRCPPPPCRHWGSVALLEQLPAQEPSGSSVGCWFIAEDIQGDESVARWRDTQGEAPSQGASVPVEFGAQLLDTWMCLSCPAWKLSESWPLGSYGGFVTRALNGT